MKNKRLLRAFSLVDDKYADEANPTSDIKLAKKHKLIKVWGAIAACFCCALAGLNLWLFIPFKNSPPDVSSYSDSEYYGIIVKLNEITYKKSLYKNNFEKYFGGLFKANADDEELAEDGSSDISGATYEEITDNQVDGIIEGDLIKRSDRYIYYFNTNTYMLQIYSIAGETSEQVGSYVIKKENDVKYLYSDNIEIYLSEDCMSVTVVYLYYTEDYSPCVAFECLDVSEPSDVTLRNRTALTGRYMSSRLVNGEFLVLMQYNVGNNPDFSDEKNFVPQISTGNGFESISADSIIYPEKLDYAQYTVIYKLTSDTLKPADCCAFLSYSENAYVSNDYVYVTRSYRDENDKPTENNTVIKKSMTEISRVAYTEKNFGDVTSVSVEGYINNRYSLGEYGGVLRAVTTTSVSEYGKKSRGNQEDIAFVTVGNTNANLYIIDFESKKIIAEVTAFAPEGETVKSVRFDGAYAYVCTSVMQTDPVFFFDLSDYENITVKDTGTIEGFSTSLIDFGDGHLLGIGVGEFSSTFKAEIYRETANGVLSLCKYELENAYCSQNYKSYYIDRANSLVGLGINRWTSGYYGTAHEARYILLLFDGYRLEELINVPIEGDYSDSRSVYIDGYLYVLDGAGLKVNKVS